MKKTTEVKQIPKSKMTVMLLQLEGSDATLQEGFKALETALNKMSPQVITYNNSRQANFFDQKKSGEDTLEFENEIPEDDYEMQTEEDDEPSNQKQSKKRSYRTPQILEIELNSGETSFKNYFTEMGSPPADANRYLIAILWLKKYKQINEVSVDHIYTIFKFMNWPVQKDVGQPLRTLKNRRLLSEGSSKKMYVINHVGEENIRRLTEKA